MGPRQELSAGQGGHPQRSRYIIIEADAFEIEHRDLVRRSVQAYRQGKGNFADYLISEISLHAGCRDDVSFDRALKGISGFTVLS